MNENEQDVSELLPAYVAGRLSASERAKVEAAVAADGRLAADLAFYRAMQQQVRATAEAGAPPGQFGWARLQKAIRASTPSAPSRAKEAWRIAAIALAGVVGVESFLLAAGAFNPPAPRYVPVAQAPAEGELSLSVAFAPEATEAALRALLVETNATIVAGPTAIGFYELRFADAAALDAARKRFLARPELVESVNPP